MEVTGLPGDDTLFITLKRWAVGHILKRALEETGGNQAEAARILGINPSSIGRRIKEFKGLASEEV